MNHHIFSVEDTFKLFNTSVKGITTDKAAELLSQHGANKLVEQKRKTALQILWTQFTDVMILVLIAAAIISGIIGDVTDTIIIIFIVILNAIIGFVQEFRAAKAIEALKKMVPSNATVVRNGFTATIPSEQLVPGDLVILEAGSIIPADIRLVEVHSFKTVEASLTGESTPVDKITSKLSDEALSLGDRFNMSYKGTYVIYGRAKGVVVATGMETELGKITALLQQEDIKTPLQKRLVDFGKKLSIIILLICILIFAIGFIRGEDPLLMLLTSISLAVAAIPEALPAVITIALAIGAKRMVRQNALIRNLPAVETLGSVTYICSDKTGTLTQNKMTVEEVYNGTDRINESKIICTEVNVKSLLTAMSLCNDVSVSYNNEIIGDPTENALFEFAEKNKFDKIILEGKHPRVGEIPFTSSRKCMTTIHENENEFVVFTKGAIDVLLNKITADDLSKARWLVKADEMASEGLRIIGFATKSLTQLPNVIDPDIIEDKLTFLGFVGIIDPPRENAKQAVEECMSAGIIPVMITGDHLLTAIAVAKKIGILQENSNVLTGVDLAQMNEEELLNKVEQTRVYARVSPEQKISIVKALQQKGQFVAMTGDGANDAPSLKRADVGVAMGITGTDVAKEASDIILLDDNFATIVKAVREGRRIFDNIRKFIRFIMTGNSGEIWTILLAPFFGLPIPLLPIHILWVNLVTDGLPGLALASEKAEVNIMNRPPRHPKESIFAHGLGIHILWVGLLIGVVSLITLTIAIETGSKNWRTMVFTVLCFSQMAHVFSIRSEKQFLFKQGIFSNLKLAGAVLLTAVLQFAIIYIPALNEIFKTTPLTISELILTILLSLVIFHAVELEKFISLKRRVTPISHV